MINQGIQPQNSLCTDKNQYGNYLNKPADYLKMEAFIVAYLF
ncbi:hypothetical protein [Bacillus sp. V2I10]|nr:hypothetical protein [Bacillus sp. V2I10]MDQ0857381.1 hypothetical protein [Bacillus sp. V2I10]